ncbi:MAG: hypothetical protein ABSC08_12715 [Bryobacteraceae bacterium]
MALPFSNYFAAYNYILVLLSYAPKTGMDASLIKLTALPFEAFAGWTAYRIAALCGCKQESDGPWRSPWHALLAIMLLPSVILNASACGQCDIIYTSFLLACTYDFMRRNGWRACFWLGMALSFKLQAIFLGPFVLLMLLRRRISLVQLGVAPLVVAALAVPPILVGRPIHQVIVLYQEQTTLYTALGMNVANWWSFVPKQFHAAGLWVALAAAAAAALAYVAIGRRRTALDEGWILFAAALSLTIMPFMLPRMHDRYFFPAEVFWAVLACARVSSFVPALLMQMAALLVYCNFLIRPWRPVRGAAVAVAAVMTTFVLVWAWKVYRDSSLSGGKAHPAGPRPGAVLA